MFSGSLSPPPSSVSLCFQSRVVVEVPPYHRNIEEPLQVQFYVSTGKRRRSLVQSFTFFPGVGRHRRHLVKQERWETDYIPHDAPGLRPVSAQVSSGGPTTARFDPCDALLHAAPRLPQPVPGFRHPARPRGHAFTTSSSVPYAAGTPSLTSRTALATPGEPLKDPVLSIKQEAEELQPILGSLGLQEITLDDGRNQPLLSNVPPVSHQFLSSSSSVTLSSLQLPLSSPPAPL